ncbi:MAG TPA: roadblock/LC7 domain-containing protein [Pseudonocardiaceae bacterium]|nr:roadblock/LC7 domain-containing protein [Pseudonocardiaceae bacterium]
MNGDQLRPGTRDLDWLLNDLIDRVPDTTGAVLLSADGLLISSSRGLGKDEGDHLAAVASAFHSLAKGAGAQFGGGAARQTIVELDTAYLIVTAAGHGACLAVLANGNVDLGTTAYEMNLLVRQVGTYLGAAPRVAATSLSTASLPGGYRLS